MSWQDKFVEDWKNRLNVKKAGGCYYIVPVGKPRMTRRDKWLNPPRPAVAKYRAFADECRRQEVWIPNDGGHVTFILPMPASWSQKKKMLMVGARHQQKPDVDNLLKALLDAVFPDDDTAVWDIRVTKVWGTSGYIRVAIQA